MDRRYRLTGSADFQRVRRTGKAYAHPLVILSTCPNGLSVARFGVTAGRSVGSAVRRNRAKRVLREALRPFLAFARPGWDVVLVARPALLTAPWTDVQEAVAGLFSRTECLVDDSDNRG